ncbi:MAG: sensor histidine kinase [Desulfobacteraceae bacterium]|nr:MAG: sensor histidine kinase [Desulfobacteraceae bacterium]
MKNNRLLQNPFYKSLMRNMFLTVILVSITPMILVIILLLSRFQTSYEEKVEAHLKELVLKHKQNIDGFLKERMNNIRYLSKVLNIEQLSDEQFLDERLAILQSEFGPVFVDMGIVNDKGKQVAYAGPFKLGEADYHEAEWFKKANTYPNFVSDVFLGLRGLPHFIVSAKKDFKGGEYILRATIDFVAFNNLVENIRIGETGFAFIVNHAGEFQTKPRAASVPNRAILDELLLEGKKIPEKVKVSRKEDSSGRDHIYVTASLKNDDWMLIYQQDTADAFSIVRKAFQIALLIFTIGSLGIVIMSYLISHRTVKRIARADQEKEMMNQQVIETGKLASIGELAAGIAHEINNPVAIMVEEAGWIQDLLEEEEFKKSENLDELNRALKQIGNQGRRCKEITHKLLSFARKTDSRTQEVDINQLIREIIGISEQRAKYSKIVFQSDLYSGLPNVRASQTEIQQIFLNIINNAIDAMEKSGGSITISTRQSTDTVMIEFADTGPGIPMANLGRIFDPFFTTKPVGKGTGLGLSICYGIVKKLGGDIQVKSVVGFGTTFQILLPAITTQNETMNINNG